MPLAVAFALAAIISPTDPVAVSSIASKVPIPKRLMHILEGESLLNDASGLVCFQFAVAAVLTGTFSVAAASLTFLWVALAGLALGVATTFGLSRIQAWIWRHFGEEPGSAILVNLLTPFAAYLLAEAFHASGILAAVYLLAEAFHASGILAAVAAGITMSYVEMAGNAPGNMRQPSRNNRGGRNNRKNSSGSSSCPASKTPETTAPSAIWTNGNGSENGRMRMR
ncbi:putative Na+/H+ antiporter [Xanthomonas citri pv. fuscans]|nr:putative Na+/H+ antiporter [Xanthomonas citri pv. fuscans]